jgi:hypothetical protein
MDEGAHSRYGRMLFSLPGFQWLLIGIIDRARSDSPIELLI